MRVEQAASPLPGSLLLGFVRPVQPLLGRSTGQYWRVRKQALGAEAGSEPFLEASMSGLAVPGPIKKLVYL